VTTAQPTAEQGATLTLDVRTAGLGADRSVDLPAEIFDAKVSIPLIHQVVVAQLAAARQGTHSTKTRGEVRGGGAKPYRQKGTGRARQGSIRAPQFVGGGVVHGPQPRDYSQRTPKKMKAAALRGALSDRARNGRIHIVDSLVVEDVPSTKQAVKLLADLTTRRHVLVVAERSDALTWKSLRNAQTVHLIAPGQLNTYDVLVSDDIVFTEGAMQAFLAGSAAAPRPPKSAKARATSGEVTPEHNTPGEDLSPHELDSDVPSVVQPEEGSK
jgi:large subunit ribosomal protein L4